jgi:cytochrome c-type biogenesis protein CcmE
MKISRLILPIIMVVLIALIYYMYFAPTIELGSFSKFDNGSEINQKINVALVKSKSFERDANGYIISFYALDKNNIEVRVSLHEPAPKEIASAIVVELLGHMHNKNITASKITIVK